MTGPGPLASRFVDAGAHRLRVWSAIGPSSRPPVVLVHGIVSSRYLLPTAEWLASRRSVFAVELPGFGRSSRPPRPLGVAELADALAAAIHVVDVSRPLLVGHSVGAQVAMEVAARHPEVAGALALVGPTGDPRVASVARLLGRWLATAVREPLGFHAIVLREIVEIGPVRMLATARRVLADPVAGKLHRVGLPVLVVRGAHDRVAPQAWIEELAAQLPDGRLRTLSGGAHTVVHSDPGRLGAMIDDFARCCLDAPSGNS